MLSVDNIRNHLNEEYRDIPIVVFDSVDSTNTQAKKSNLNRGIFAARHQSAGRGRQGKSFYSPLDTGLYMSVILPITPIQAYEFSLTAAAAVAAVRAIEKTCGIRPKIKWVNDLYLGGKKIAGILTEADKDRVIVGIGINISTSAFPQDIPLGGSLEKADLSPSQLCAEIAQNLYDITQNDKSDFMSEYQNNSVLIGENIKFEKDENVYFAKALRIEDNGTLTVLCDGEELNLHSGEVHIIM